MNTNNAFDLEKLNKKEKEIFFYSLVDYLYFITEIKSINFQGKSYYNKNQALSKPNKCGCLTGREIPDDPKIDIHKKGFECELNFEIIEKNLAFVNIDKYEDNYEICSMYQTEFGKLFLQQEREEDIIDAFDKIKLLLNKSIIILKI